MNTKLLIIDPQNDFCDIPGAALPVAGADDDMKRLAAFIEAHAAKLSGITVTLDSHPSVAVERTTFWKQGDGSDVQPFTEITVDAMRAGRFLPRDEGLIDTVAGMLEKLEAGGKYRLMVWPVHCVTGTWGHNIHEAVARQLNAWEFMRQKAVRKVFKGEFALSEHYGALEAEVPFENEETTQFNSRLAESLLKDADLLLVAGEASSHCVAASLEQLLRYAQGQARKLPTIVLLGDCMSPVGGFEGAEAAFFDRVAAQGVKRMTASQAAALLN